jgi:hypothetical protein
MFSTRRSNDVMWTLMKKVQNKILKNNLNKKSLDSQFLKKNNKNVNKIK